MAEAKTKPKPKNGRTFSENAYEPPQDVATLLRPCCGFVADLLRFKSLMFNAVADVADFQTSYADTLQRNTETPSDLARAVTAQRAVTHHVSDFLQGLATVIV
jgi:hypothetical protein